jgi:type I restriction enzyme S subunit
MNLGKYIKLLSGQHIEALHVNCKGVGVAYLTGPADFIGKKPVATKYTEYPKVCCDKGDILITVKGSGTGSIAISDAIYCISRQLMAIRCKDIDFFFAQYLLELNEKKFNSSAAGLIPGISRKDVLRLRVPQIQITEQKAIADLLSIWDEAIEKIERLIQAKERRFKRLLNDLIHQGRSNHTWKGFNLSDLCVTVSRKNIENNTNVLTSSAQNGLVSQLEYYNKSVSAENVTGYYLLKKGEFAYNRSSAKGYPYGATKRLDRYEKGVLSTLYLCFALKSDAPCESDFLLHLFESGAANRELRAVCQEGARSHGLLNITKSDFFGIKLFLPSQEQQQKIQFALNTALQELDLLKQLAEKYKTQKRGLMQKILTGEWRIKHEIVNQYKGM